MKPCAEHSIGIGNDSHEHHSTKGIDVFVIFDQHKNNKVVGVSDSSSLVNTYNALCKRAPRRYGFRIVNDFTRSQRKRALLRG